MSQSFTNKDFIPQIPAMYLFSLRLLQSSVSFLFFCLCSLFFHHCRCPTPNLTSERKQYWSCTRCFWSTQSPSALLSPGSRRNWRTQTQVSGKMLPCRLSRHHLSPMNYSSATNMKLSLVYLWHSQASSGNTRQLAGFLLLRLKCLPWHVTRMHCDFTLIYCLAVLPFPSHEPFFRSLSLLCFAQLLGSFLKFLCLRLMHLLIFRCPVCSSKCNLWAGSKKP